jgi:hypothetical protein
MSEKKTPQNALQSSFKGQRKETIEPLPKTQQRGK